MKIIEPYDERGLVVAIIAGRWVQARVMCTPSTFGINSGRVCKCCVSKTANHDPSKSFLDQMDYNYQLGLNFDNLPDGLLDRIVAELESLPA